MRSSVKKTIFCIIILTSLMCSCSYFHERTLIKQLNSDSSEEKISAAEELGILKSKKAIKPLFYAMSDSNKNVGKAAKSALVNIGEPAVETLIGALVDSNSRKNAIIVLCEINDPRAITPLISLIKQEKDNSMRNYILNLSVGLGPGIIDPLASLFREIDDESVQRKIISVLGELNHPKAIKPLMEIYADHENLQIAIAKTMKNIKHPECIDALMIMIQNDQEYVRRYASYSIVEFGDDALEKLHKAFRNEENQYRLWIVTAIGKIADPSSIDILNTAFNDEDRNIRLRAFEALNELTTGPDRFKLFKQAINDNHSFITSAAFDFLKEDASDMAHDLLLEAMTTHKNKYIRRRAESAYNDRLRSINKKKK
ncbi:HEAT repeat domain-containing protein [candidate division CSSED10-310 bacterium]|uniref:HEAT repeat domain-containing protein n=1 Tax=candidate division CSSED10-310 bacterium TaxID=2855610 RepID=A0ABV6Z132_UNCC1